MNLEELIEGKNGEGKSALVVDDDRLLRRIIVNIMERQGYKTLEGCDGNEAISLCIAEKPDILIIDISMPERDGISAVREIKQQLPNHYMPIIFVTASENEETLTECILAGGDDFLVKPFNSILLRAKLIAVERNRKMYNELHELHSDLQRSQEVAKAVFSRAVVSPNIEYAGLKTFIRSASTFSGDLLLTAARPNGDLNVLIGDFTGHGLSAAIGAIPVSETFRAMTAKGYSGPEIIHQMGKKLCHMLPTGIFFSSALATISHEFKTVSVWNGGMPDIWLFQKDPTIIKKRFISNYPPLGIVPNNIDDIQFEVLDLLPGDTLIMCSDGLLEARNSSNEYFGEERYFNVVKTGMKQGNVSDLLMKNLDEFIEKHSIEDDVTFAEIPFNSAAATASNTKQIKQKNLSQHDRWQWQVRIEDQMLSKTDLVPLAMNQLRDLLPENDNLNQIYTVFTELYLNALEHGVLSLPSSMKSNAAGFAKYFSEKEKRLKAVDSGWIDTKLQYESGEGHAQLVIEIRDSGPGFDVDKWLRNFHQSEQFSGRGLNLVMELATEVAYQPPGNHVKATIEWSEEDDGEAIH